MSENDTSVKIRLEISVPVGVPVQARPGFGGGISVLFDQAVKPSGDVVNDGDTVCVKPKADSALGTVELGFVYSTNPSQVWAMVIPLSADTGQVSNTHPGNAMQADSIVNGVARWANLGSADHTAGSVPNNIVRLWTLIGGNESADPRTLTFKGCTQGSGTCGGSGSGPSGSGLNGSTISTFPGRPNLKLRVPAGPHAGEHTARCIGSLQWEAVIGGTHYLINLSPDGSAAFLTCPTTGVRAKSAGLSPYCAVFPGSIFGAGGDVLVWQE